MPPVFGMGGWAACSGAVWTHRSRTRDSPAATRASQAPVAARGRSHSALALWEGHSCRDSGFARGCRGQRPLPQRAGAVGAAFLPRLDLARGCRGQRPLPQRTGSVGAAFLPRLRHRTRLSRPEAAPTARGLCGSGIPAATSASHAAVARPEHRIGDMHIHHHGAGNGVTSSCHQLTLDAGRALLIDCGLFQGDEAGPVGARRAARDRLCGGAHHGADCHQRAHRARRAPAIAAGGRLPRADPMQPGVGGAAGAGAEGPAGDGLYGQRAADRAGPRRPRRRLLDSGFGTQRARMTQWGTLDPRTCCADGHAEPSQDLHHAA